MSDRSHKRSRSYFNVFTVADAEPQPAKPTEQQLQEIRVQQLRGHRKSNSATLTIPGSVKFSVTGDTPNKQPELAFTRALSSSNSTTMARPRSPQKKHDTSPDKMELILDQKLLAIRQQLSALSNDRLKMEQQMEELTNGIREARTQCSTRRYSLVSQHSGSSLRRVRSVGEGQANGVKIARRGSKDDIDGPPLEDDISSKSFGSTPRESLGESPLAAHRSFSDSSSARSSTSTSTHSYSASRSSRSSSFSIPKIAVSSLSNDVFVEDCSTILELPESPRRSTSSLSLVSSRQGTPIFREFSLSPSLCSTPDLIKKPMRNVNHSSLRSQRNSLPEVVLNQLRHEGSFETLSCSDSLSQVSSCTEEGSPQTGSTLILRRSSLTGQMEHIRKPRELKQVKRNSSFSSAASEKLMAPASGLLSSSFGNLREAPRMDYQVLNKGHRSHRRRQKRVILSSVETTV